MVQNPFDPHGGANPFEAPRAREVPATYTPGTVDIGVALSEAWAATWRNIWPWVGVLFLGGLVMVASMFTVIGIFLVWPVLFWGYILFNLKALDGQAEVGDLFAGFSRFGAVIWPMLGLGFLLFLAALPGQAVSNGAPFLVKRSPGLVTGFGTAFSLAWNSFVTVRLYLAPYLVVEQKKGALEALQASWTITSEQKLNMALLGFISFLIVIAGALALLVGVIPATFLSYVTFASAYRQLTGVPAFTWQRALAAG